MGGVRRCVPVLMLLLASCSNSTSTAPTPVVTSSPSLIPRTSPQPLTEDARIEGRILRPDGEPAAEVFVDVERVSKPPGGFLAAAACFVRPEALGCGSDDAYDTRTDDDGRFTLEIPPKRNAKSKTPQHFSVRVALPASDDAKSGPAIEWSIGLATVPPPLTHRFTDARPAISQRGHQLQIRPTAARTTQDALFVADQVGRTGVLSSIAWRLREEPNEPLPARQVLKSVDARMFGGLVGAFSATSTRRLTTDVLETAFTSSVPLPDDVGQPPSADGTCEGESYLGGGCSLTDGLLRPRTLWVTEPRDPVRPVPADPPEDSIVVDLEESAPRDVAFAYIDDHGRGELDVSEDGRTWITVGRVDGDGVIRVPLDGLRVRYIRFVTGRKGETEVRGQLDDVLELAVW